MHARDSIEPHSHPQHGPCGFRRSDDLSADSHLLQQAQRPGCDGPSVRLPRDGLHWPGSARRVQVERIEALTTKGTKEKTFQRVPRINSSVRIDIFRLADLRDSLSPA